MTEGDENNRTINLQVTLSSALSAARTLYYYTTDGTAKVGDNDYVGVTQVENKSIALTTATTTFYIPIQIKGDLIQGVRGEFSGDHYLSGRIGNQRISRNGHDQRQ